MDEIQVLWGDNSTINDHKINSDICLQGLSYQYNNSKRFLKNPEICERVVVFRKVGEQKKTEIRIHLTSEYKLYSGMNLRSILSPSFKYRSVLFLLQPPF